MQERFQEAFGVVENIWERTARAYDEQIDIPETGGGREGSELLHENGSRTDSPELFGAVARREELTGVVKRTIEKVNPPERPASVPAGLRQGTEQEELSGAGKRAEEFKDGLTEIHDVSLADIISTQPSPEEEERQEDGDRKHKRSRIRNRESVW